MASTNLLGSAMVAREAVRDMRRRGQWGHIFNMVGLSGVWVRVLLCKRGLGVVVLLTRGRGWWRPCRGRGDGRQSANGCPRARSPLPPRAHAPGHRIPDAAAGGSFFCATKFGVRAITDGLRQEVNFVWAVVCVFVHA